MEELPTRKQIEAYCACSPLFGGMTQTEAACYLGISQQAIQERLRALYRNFPNALPVDLDDPKTISLKEYHENFIREKL